MTTPEIVGWICAIVSGALLIGSQTILWLDVRALAKCQAESDDSDLSRSRVR